MMRPRTSVPCRRHWQKTLPSACTRRSTGKAAVEASSILFGEGTAESLKKLSEKDLLSMFEGVPQAAIARTDLEAGVGVVDFLSVKCWNSRVKGRAEQQADQLLVLANKAKVTLAVSQATLSCFRFALGSRRRRSQSLWKMPSRSVRR